MTDFARRRINILYDTLSEIRLSIVEISRINEYVNNSNNNIRNPPFQLSYDQRYLIDLYCNMYNSTLRQLDYLERYSENVNNLNRVYINGQPYIIEQIDLEVPSSNTNANEREPQQRTGERPTTPINTNLFNTNLFNVDDLLNETFRSFTSQVVVRPTEEQIENATRCILFGDVENPINTSCPICLDVFEPTTSVMQIRECQHLFSPTEIQRWFQTNVKCPVCRYDIRGNNYSSSSPHSTSTAQVPRETINSRSRRYRYSMNTNPSLQRPNNNNNSLNYERSGDQLLTNVLTGFLDPSGNQNLIFDSIFRM
jgi:hypothetical protein